MHHHRSHHKRRSLVAPLIAIITVIVLAGLGAALFMDVKPQQQLVEKELDAKAFLAAQQ